MTCSCSEGRIGRVGQTRHEQVAGSAWAHDRQGHRVPLPSCPQSHDASRRSVPGANGPGTRLSAASRPAKRFAGCAIPLVSLGERHLYRSHPCSGHSHRVRLSPRSAACARDRCRVGDVDDVCNQPGTGRSPLAPRYLMPSNRPSANQKQPGSDYCTHRDTSCDDGDSDNIPALTVGISGTETGYSSPNHAVGANKRRSRASRIASSRLEWDSGSRPRGPILFMTHELIYARGAAPAATSQSSHPAPVSPLSPSGLDVSGSSTWTHINCPPSRRCTLLRWAQ